MSIWETTAAAVTNEFLDVSDLATMVQMIIRLLLAILLGGILGYEREQQGKAAGLRTHILVCVGTAMLVLAAGPTEAVQDPMSRIIQGILAGIGFLCAGSIIKNNAENDVHGLTTAASVWFTASIGVVIGLGQIMLGILSTLFAVVVLHCLPAVFERGRKNAIEKDD